MAADTLSSEQVSALLDILTHAETYGEIRDFRAPGSLSHYGPPFTSESRKPSTSPALQALVSRFLLPLPGLRDLTTDFWRVQLSTIIGDLEKADLSESYDKGLLGSRKTLATAISALIEYPVRGTFAGFDKREDPQRKYDLYNADDLAQSFRDFMQEAVYGKIVDELVAKAAETDQLADHEPIVQALHEYVLVK
jgi:PX-associated